MAILIFVTNCRWWICGLVLHRDQWLIPFLLYLCVSIWILGQYVPIELLSGYSLTVINVYDRPIIWMWTNTFARATQLIPLKLQIPAASLFIIAIIFLGTFLSPETPNNTYRSRGISIGGLFLLYFILYITSTNRKRIAWPTVLMGLLCQYLICLFVLRTEVGYDIFSFISSLARYANLILERLT